MQLSDVCMLRPLARDELSPESPSQPFPFVVEGRGPRRSTEQLASRHGRELLDLVERRGAVLLRDVGIHNVHAAEALLRGIGLELTEYTAGVSPRRQLSGGLSSSTEAPAPYIISAHTEMCYVRERPGKLMFYCETAPKRHGETPVFDFEAVLSDLTPATRARVRREGFLYRRYLRARPSWLNVDKSVGQVFGESERETVSKLCTDYGLDATWQPDGALVIDFRSPGTVVHPSTGAECLSMTLLNEYAAWMNLKRFSHRLNPALRLAVSSFAFIKARRNNSFFKTLWGNGEPISAAETREFIDAYWRNATLFSWRKGDLLLLDNIRFGHGRMNVQKPRLIAVGMAEPYNVERMPVAASMRRTA